MILQIIKTIIIPKASNSLITSTMFPAGIERRVYMVDSIMIMADYILDTILLTIVTSNDISSDIPQIGELTNQGTMEDKLVYCVKVKK